MQGKIEDEHAKRQEIEETHQQQINELESRLSQLKQEITESEDHSSKQAESRVLE